MAVSKRLRYEIFRRDNHACRYCGASAPGATLTVDHVVPSALGGADSADNLVTACAVCNSGKSSSSPDASLVAQVSEDALRWASAVQLAAAKMEEDVARHNRTRSRVRSAWTKGEGPTLPADWKASVDSFVNAGLPVSVLVDCIEIALSNRKIPSAARWRYMCGVAWKKVRDLHGNVRAQVGAQVLTPACRTDLSGFLVGAFGWCGDVRKMEELARKFDDDHTDDELQAGEKVPYSAWSSVDKAVAEGVAELEEWHRWLRYISKVVFRALSDDAAAEFRSASLEAHRCAGEAWPTDIEVDGYALTLAVQFLCDKASAPIEAVRT